MFDCFTSWCFPLSSGSGQHPVSYQRRQWNVPYQSELPAPFPPRADNCCAVTGTFLNPLQDLGSGCLSVLFPTALPAVHGDLKFSSPASPQQGPGVAVQLVVEGENAPSLCVGVRSITNHPPTHPFVYIYLNLYQKKHN